LNIHLNTKDRVDITISNVQGKGLIKSRFMGEKIVQIELPEESGVYFIKVKTTKGQSIHMIIRE